MAFLYPVDKQELFLLKNKLQTVRCEPLSSMRNGHAQPVQLFAEAFADTRYRGVETNHLATGLAAALRICTELGCPVTPQ